MPVDAPAEGRAERGGANLAALREWLRRYDRGGVTARGRAAVPTGLAALDAVLPGGGVPAGAVTEVLHDRSESGALSLAVRVARQVAGAAGEVVFIEPFGDLYPPALRQVGLSESQVLVVRPGCRRDRLWACDQALRCRGVAAVVAAFGHLDAGTSRRLQLAAESGGGVGLILRPASTTTTFAALQLRIESRRDGPAARGLRGRRTYAGGPVRQIAVTRARGMTLAVPIRVEMDEQTGDVPVHAVAADRAAGGRRHGGAA